MPADQRWERSIAAPLVPDKNPWAAFAPGPEGLPPTIHGLRMASAWPAARSPRRSTANLRTNLSQVGLQPPSLTARRAHIRSGPGGSTGPGGDAVAVAVDLVAGVGLRSPRNAREYSSTRSPRPETCHHLRTSGARLPRRGRKWRETQPSIRSISRLLTPDFTGKK